MRPTTAHLKIRRVRASSWHHLNLNLQGYVLKGYKLVLMKFKFGLVVQLVRMPACHAGGRGFESLPGRQMKVNSGFIFTIHYYYLKLA